MDGLKYRVVLAETYMPLEKDFMALDAIVTVEQSDWSKQNFTYYAGWFNSLEDAEEYATLVKK